MHPGSRLCSRDRPQGPSFLERLHEQGRLSKKAPLILSLPRSHPTARVAVHDVGSLQNRPRSGSLLLDLGSPMVFAIGMGPAGMGLGWSSTARGTRPRRRARPSPSATFLAAEPAKSPSPMAMHVATRMLFADSTPFGKGPSASSLPRWNYLPVRSSQLARR
jgi:hypothetical protein